MTPRWLGLALFAEGPTDHRFLEELLRRSVEHLLISGGHHVELGPVQRLLIPREARTREAKIALGAERVQGGFHILFVHADGDGEPSKAHAERVTPGLTAMHDRLGDGMRCGVGVVPVRETEAWALADYDAVREVLGTNATPEALGLPASPEVLEGISDPKQLLEEVVRVARGGRRGRARRKPSTYLDLLGERSRIEKLAKLPAFQHFLRDLTAALQHLGFRN